MATTKCKGRPTQKTEEQTAIAMDAAFETFALLEMLARESDLPNEEWFPYVLRNSLQRLVELNAVQMSMFDDEVPPSSEHMREMMFGRRVAA